MLMKQRICCLILNSLKSNVKFQYRTRYMSTMSTEKSGLEFDTDPEIGEPVADPSPAPRPSRTTLKGRVVTLEPLDPDVHSKDLFETIGGQERDRLWMYMHAGPFHNLVEFHEEMVKRSKSNDPIFYAIVDNKSGRAVGTCSYLRITPEHRTIEVGHIAYSPFLQRTVGATEAQYLMAKHAIEDLGYRRYEWKCDALNKLSRRAALRYGFEFDGVFKQHMIINGRNRDTAWFSMLDKHWPKRKKAFETWLSSDNFDDNGVQKQSLSDINRLIDEQN